MGSKHHVIDERSPVWSELILGYKCSCTGIVDMAM